MSGEVVLMTLVGGLGTLFGPVAGAFFIIAMQTYLSSIGQWVSVIQGGIFVACVLLFRRGIVGELLALGQWLTRGGKAHGTAYVATAPAPAGE